MSSQVTTVYTDGSCSKRRGGWAWAVKDGPQDCGFVPDTTNQRMEMMAALQACKSLEGPLHIMSDSRYLVDCFNQGWYKKWLRNGWKTYNDQPVKNVDLWQDLLVYFLTEDIQFDWIKGHSVDKMNQYVDTLAVNARKEGK
jgi:ribonuclease HI